MKYTEREVINLLHKCWGVAFESGNKLEFGASDLAWREYKKYLLKQPPGYKYVLEDYPWNDKEES